jgi:perosamine synthetase
MDVPLVVPYIDEREEEIVLDVLRSGWFAHGPRNKEFEADWAKKFGVKHAISMNSCASTLHVAIQASGITGEVILPSFTFVASANAVITAGAIPVFADIDPDTLNIDPKSIEALITDKTEAIMPVHWAGQVADMTAIIELAEKHNLVVIEDSAETIGGTHKGQLGGTWGIGCYSFYPGKNMTTAEGGMFTTNDDAVAEKARIIMGHGISKTTLDRHEGKAQPWIRSAVMAGYNFRMSNLHAAIGVVQLSKLDEMNNKRQENAAYYMDGFMNIEGLVLPHVESENSHVWQMFTVKVDMDKRDDLVNYLRDQGIGASVHFDPPLHKMKPYANVKNAENLPITNDAYKRIITLPMFPHLTKEQMDFVIKHIKIFLNV